MPAHINFGDRLLQIAGYVSLKVGGNRKEDRGYSMADVGYYIGKMVEERQCVVPDYPTYRNVVDYWNPGGHHWSKSDGPQGPGPERSRKARMGGHRSTNGAIDATFEGQHQAPTPGRQHGFKSVNALNTTPVSQTEWTTYLAAGCPTDRMIKAIFERNAGVKLMFIRAGHASKRDEMLKLKRIEMGSGKIWDILWTNHDV